MYLRHFGKRRRAGFPEACRIVRVARNVVEVELQRFFIVARLGLVEPLRDIEDDACEAVGIKVDFLVVGDLADVARSVC